MNTRHTYEDDTHDDYDYIDDNSCHHGNRMHECDECDTEIEAQGGIDKCMNCGRYKYGNQLSAFQVCIKQCRNPAEY